MTTTTTTCYPRGARSLAKKRRDVDTHAAIATLCGIVHSIHAGPAGTTTAATRC
jgi:hypothetical protein